MLVCNIAETPSPFTLRSLKKLQRCRLTCSGWPCADTVRQQSDKRPTGLQRLPSISRRLPRILCLQRFRSLKLLQPCGSVHSQSLIWSYGASHGHCLITSQFSRRRLLFLLTANAQEENVRKSVCRFVTCYSAAQ